VVVTSFETAPPRSVLHRFWIPPDNFEFRHASFLQSRSGYGSTSIDTALKATEMPSLGLSVLGLWVRGFAWPLRSKMRNSQKVLVLAQHLQKNKHRHWAKESSLDCRPGDFCRNRDARNFLIIPKNPHFSIAARATASLQAALGEPSPHPPLAQHVPCSQSLNSEVKQNDNLCSTISALPFTEDPARFATSRWVLGTETKRSFDSYSDADVGSSGVSTDGCSSAPCWRLVL